MSSFPGPGPSKSSTPIVPKGCLKKSSSPKDSNAPRKSISFRSSIIDLEECQMQPARTKRQRGACGIQTELDALAFECDRDNSSVMGELSEELENELRVMSKDIDRLNSLGKLVEEENEEIRQMNKFKTRAQTQTRRPQISFNEFVEKMYEICSYPTREKPDDETQTEAAAAMLHLEEIGMNMTSSPAKIFNSLFPVESNIVNLADVRLEVTDGHTIPMARPMRFLPKDAPYEDAAMLDYMPSDKAGGIPDAPGVGPASGNLAELLGTSGLELEKARERDLYNESDEFQITLDMMPSTKASLVQIQGSQPPNWFPGYFALLPNIPGVRKYEKPWAVLEKAWKAVVPSRIKPKNGPIIVGS